MSKQRTNNNKRPANSRPASSKGRSNSSEGGGRGPKASGTRSSSSRSEGERSSSRSGFDKKASSKRPASSRGGSKGPKEEKDLYGSKRTTQSKSSKFETSKRAVGRGPSGRKPAKKSFTSDREEKFIPYNLRSDETKSPYTPRGERSSSEEKRFEPKGEKRFDSRAGGERGGAAKRSYTKRGEGSAEYKSRAGEGRSSVARKPAGPKKDFEGRGSRGGDAAKFPNKRSASSSREDAGDFKRKSAPAKRTFVSKASDAPKPRGRREISNDDDFDNDIEDDDFNEAGEKQHKPKFDKTEVKKGRKAYENKLDKLSKPKPNAVKVSVPDSFDIRLNKYISNSGVCSRREADQLILEGTVKVNGVVITELGYKVKPGDSVKYNNKVLNPEKSVYVLLNKPKDFITTMEDENDRKTVMQLVANSTKERIYPVGRLDRNTTGLLLFTNDGELAQKLTHPSNKVKKIYEVELDKPITAEDFDKIVDGKIHLFDGPVKVDEAAIISPSKKIIGIEIHEGRNRIVRRIFESLGYEVQKLDRVMYAGLTKKNIPRGSWRYLTATEVNKIKYLD